MNISEELEPEGIPGFHNDCGIEIITSTSSGMKKN